MAAERNDAPASADPCPCPPAAGSAEPARRAPRGSTGGRLGLRSELARRERELAAAHAARHHDPLTDLPDRTLLLLRLRGELAASAGEGFPSPAVVVLDLDRFGHYSDGGGHGAGDELLRQVARRLRAAVAPRDLVARLGSDEFAVLVPGLESAAEAAVLCRRLLAAVSGGSPATPDDHRPSACAGVALAEAGVAAAELLGRAELALHRAQERGRGLWQAFEPALGGRAVERLRTEMDLRAALERDELRLAYQPLLDLRSDRLAGLEALVRWRHPRRGILPPDAFVPLAEETGLILPMGAWVLRRAAAGIERWRATGGELTVAVNLSARQLHDPALLPTLRELAPPAGSRVRLGLELTESTLMDDPAAAAELLGRVRDLGIHLSLDDFGTGHSSLVHLLRLPLDALKIDRAFVRELAGERAAGARQLVAAVTDLAHRLGLTVVAEGVESEAQRRELVALGVDQAQGFLFAPPVAEESVGRMLLGAG